MILLFEENPKLITYLDIEKEEKEGALVFSKKERALGSKGLVASQILRQAEVAHKVLTPLGGKIGQIIKEFAREENLGLVDLDIKDPSQEEFILRGGKSLKIQSRAPRLTQEERNRLYTNLSVYQEEIKTLILFAGEDTLEEKYPYFLERGYDLGHKTFLEGGGNLGQMLESRPYLLVCKKAQVEDFIGIACNFAHEVEKASRILLAKGLHSVYILGQGGVDLYANGEEMMTVHHPKERALDTGLVTLGLAIAHDKKYNLDLALRYAVSLAQESLEGSRKPDLVKIKQNMKEVEVKGARKYE